MKTSGNTVLITGGGTGIGLALAEALLGKGNEVIICGRRKEKLEAAKDNNPGLAIFQCDVAEDADRRALFDSAVKDFPKLNVLVNNAGIQRRVDLLGGEAALAGGDEEVRINLAAPVHLSALFIPHLMKQAEAAIINVSSGLAFVPMARFPLYCATKAAIHSYTLSLRHQLAGTSVRVFEAIPPMVQSELSNIRDPEVSRRAMPAATCAEAIIDGLGKDQFEMGIGFAEGLRTSTRAEAEERFKQMNG